MRMRAGKLTEQVFRVGPWSSEPRLRGSALVAFASSSSSFSFFASSVAAFSAAVCSADALLGSSDGFSGTGDDVSGVWLGAPIFVRNLSHSIRNLMPNFS